jgi:basic amino acid/polyamine antiporter, APA family
MDSQLPRGLIRAMGRWTLTALVINSIIGSGIFGLPSVVAGYLAAWSPLAYLIGAIAMAVVMSCFAEVASQFGQSGGPYLYSREAFGRFAGIETGWLTWLSRSTALAAAVNLFVNYLAQFWPDAQRTLPRYAISTILIGFLTLVNYYGVKSGAATSNIFTVAKLSALFTFAIAGGIFLLHPHAASAPSLAAMPASTFPLRNWFEAMLAILFAYGGFESAVVPMAEAKNPRRDVPFALCVALLTTAVLYCLIQYIVVLVLPSAAATDRPLALAAQLMWGSWGASLIAAAALVSVYGFLSAHMLNSPRLAFALGEHGDFPSLFSRVHPRYRTPHISILISAAFVWILAAFGNFTWNVILSAVARVFVYILVCAALPVLRRKRPAASAFRIPAGDFVAALGVTLMLILVLRMRISEWIVILGTIAIAFANWRWVRQPDQLPGSVGE